MHRSCTGGVILFFVAGLLLWMLDTSLSSEAGFAAIQDILGGTLAKLILWGALSALAYHFVAGIRHLVMDIGIGESLEGGRLGAKLVFVATVVLILLAGVWVW